MPDIRLLIVDDEPELSEFVRKRLQHEAPHFYIDTVASGRECLDYLRENMADCILSDYQMPGMGGIELLARIREMGDDTPLIFVTGQGSEEVAREAFKAGAWDYFTKDAGFAHFAKIINSVEQAVRSRDAQKSRLRAEEALRLSEERMFKAQRMAHVGNWEWDIAGNRTYWSDEVYRIYGRDPERFVLTFESVREAMHPDDLEPFVKAVNAAIYERAPFELDYRLIRPDGTVRTVHTIGEVTYDPSGKPLMKSGTVQDITEQKQAQESLLLFMNLINQSKDAICVNDPATGRIIFANDKACSNLGYDRTELLTMRTIDLDAIFPDQAAWDAHVNEVRSKGSLILEGMNRRNDGLLFPVEVNVTYMTLGDKDYMLAVLRDITERKQAEEVLRKSEARLAEAEVVAKLGSWEWLAEENRAARSDGLLKIFGVNREDMGTTFESYLDIIHPDDRETVAGTHKWTLKSGARLDYDARIVRPDGVERIIHVYGDISFTEDGKPHRVFGTVQDITERRYLEKQKDHLLEMIRHDMKTPLAVIMGNVEMALLKGKEALGEDIHKAMKSIHANATNLSVMSDDLVIISGIESSGLRRAMEKVDPNDLLIEASIIISGLVGNKGLSFERKVLNDLPHLVIDGLHVLRAVTNLLQNAVNYTPDGGSIVLSAWSSGRGEDECVYISVSDDGVGIPAGEHAKVFEKYYRAANSKGVRGSGLGLAIVKAVAQEHGGRVEIESEVGKGSTFRIVLPVLLRPS